MKFHDMPYERVDFDQVEKAFEELKKSFAAAGSAEEQFATMCIRDRGYLEAVRKSYMPHPG